MPQLLSVVITTYNNQAKIKATLESVKWANEIIIVDGHSADDTVKICRRYTDKIYFQLNYPQWNINKNYGFKKATGDWVLNLDSDEIVTEPLKDEIKQILEKGTDCDFFYVPRREHFFGKWIKSIWGPQPLHIKLFKKGTAFYECRHLHELMRVNGKKGALKGHITHNAYVTMPELLERIDAFTDEEAKCLKRDGYKLRWRHFLTRPGRYIFYAYIKQKGFKNGLREFLTIILWCGYYQFVTLVKFFKLERRKV